MWGVLPKSENARAILGSDRAHSLLALYARAMIRASYEWTLLWDSATEPAWELSDAMNQLSVNTALFIEFFGFSESAAPDEFLNELHHAAERLAKRLVAVLHAGFSTDEDFADSFARIPETTHIAVKDDEDLEIDNSDVLEWCQNGCPLFY